MLEGFFDTIFGPLLNLNAIWAIMIVAFIVSLLITLIYKWMTDQHMMKKLKDELKDFQKQMKEFKDNPKKVMEIQKKAMETNMKYMMHSLKPTLITFLPIILIFGWLSANFAYDPIMPNTEFTTTAVFEEGANGKISLNVPEGVEILNDKEQEIKEGTARWTLKGITGKYILEYNYNENIYDKEVLITEEKEYIEPLKEIEKDGIKSISIDNEKKRPLNLFGWRLGWLGTYIIFSIAFSMSLRKLLKLH